MLKLPLQFAMCLNISLVPQLLHSQGRACEERSPENVRLCRRGSDCPLWASIPSFPFYILHFVPLVYSIMILLLFFLFHFPSWISLELLFWTFSPRICFTNTNALCPPFIPCNRSPCQNSSFGHFGDGHHNLLMKKASTF